MENKIIQRKICLLGSFAVGKTSLVRRFVYNLFDEKYLSTIGVTISRKQVQVTDDTLLQMVIWDLAGGDEFNGKHASYLQGSAGALLVCDLTREETFRQLLAYREKIRNISPKAKVVVFGNKSDLVGSLQEAELRLTQLAHEMDAPQFLTSAKDGANVEYGLQVLAQNLVESPK